jgi:hypothetical protein
VEVLARPAMLWSHSNVRFLPLSALAIRRRVEKGKRRLERANWGHKWVALGPRDGYVYRGRMFLSKETEHFRAMLVATLLCCCILPAIANDLKNPNHEPAAVVRIIVRNGHIVEVTPVSGSQRATATAIEFVKKNWKFAPGQNGVFTLPVVIKQEK